MEDFETKSNIDPSEEDEFEKLRVAREKERMERQKLKLARSISTAPGITLDGEIAVDQPAVPQPTASQQPAGPPADVSISDETDGDKTPTMARTPSKGNL